MDKVYTGIGSRETPDDVIDTIHDLAWKLARGGWIVRSGGAPGADNAFWGGAALYDVGATEIYLPWKGFEGYEAHQVARTEPQEEAYPIAEQFHPRWAYLKFGAKKLHARNVHQILGRDVTTPVLPSFVVCWTKGGKLQGGTAQALRIAEHYEVPIFNLGNEWTLALFRDMLNP